MAIQPECYHQGIIIEKGSYVKRAHGRAKKMVENSVSFQWIMATLILLLGTKKRGEMVEMNYR